MSLPPCLSFALPKWTNIAPTCVIMKSELCKEDSTHNQSFLHSQYMLLGCTMVYNFSSLVSTGYLRRKVEDIILCNLCILQFEEEGTLSSSQKEALLGGAASRPEQPHSPLTCWHFLLWLTETIYHLFQRYQECRKV